MFSQQFHNLDIIIKQKTYLLYTVYIEKVVQLQNVAEEKLGTR
jgi:hypothetical protein